MTAGTHPLASFIMNRLWANLTPRGAQGFSPHADQHDFFIMQMKSAVRLSMDPSGYICSGIMRLITRHPARRLIRESAGVEAFQ